jgi:transcriptional regulator with XRE-family HTH domain
LTQAGRGIIASDDAGQRLRRTREHLGLKFREVELASQKIADKHGNEEYSIGLSRLSDIENRGVVPSIYRLYSLSTIYRLDFKEVLSWYGVDLSDQPADSLSFEHQRTHTVGYTANGFGMVQAPLGLDPGLDLSKTSFLSRLISRWGSLPLHMLKGLDLKQPRYAFLGSEDWSMHPVLQPGSLLLIDESRKVVNNGWGDEWERPIYFLQHREGYLCGWCHQEKDRLMVLFHPGSLQPPRLYEFPKEIDVIGQVVGTATSLDSLRRKRSRSSDGAG